MHELDYSYNVYLNNIIIISQGTNMVIDGDALKVTTDNFSNVIGCGGFSGSL